MHMGKLFIFYLRESLSYKEPFSDMLTGLHVLQHDSLGDNSRLTLAFSLLLQMGLFCSHISIATSHPASQGVLLTLSFRECSKALKEGCSLHSTAKSHIDLQGKECWSSSQWFRNMELLFKSSKSYNIKLFKLHKQAWYNDTYL